VVAVEPTNGRINAGNFDARCASSRKDHRQCPDGLVCLSGFARGLVSGKLYGKPFNEAWVLPNRGDVARRETLRNGGPLVSQRERARGGDFDV